ncbi:MAG: hypothetical protein J0M12_01245 [Deltaproteobacteria bacterium]|nr:hypothetical protein [Deltaproteobacteria bacterium]
MTDNKANEGKKDSGCCGGSAKTTSASTGCCSTDKASTQAPADSKANKGGCGCS